MRVRHEPLVHDVDSHVHVCLRVALELRANLSFIFLARCVAETGYMSLPCKAAFLLAGLIGEQRSVIFSLSA